MDSAQSKFSPNVRIQISTAGKNSFKNYINSIKKRWWSHNSQLGTFILN